jgi:hypothetical protein
LGKGREELVRSKHFVTESVTLKAGGGLTPAPESCQLWIVLEGAGAIGGEKFRRGVVWLLPETGEQPSISATSGSRFLRTYAPALGTPISQLASLPVLAPEFQSTKSLAAAHLRTPAVS